MFPHTHSKVLKKYCKDWEKLRGIKGGFNLTKWNSSSPDSLISIEPKLKLRPDNALAQSQKVLGLPWIAALDCYVIESKPLQKTRLQAT